MRTFSDWLGAVGGTLGFITTVVLFIANLQNWATDPNMLHIFSVAAFLLFVVGVLWFFSQSNVATIWRRGSLVLLYIFSSFFFMWVGTWYTDSSQVMIEKGAFAPEQASATAFGYQGVDDPTSGEGRGRFEVSTTVSKGTFETSYRLDYDIPSSSNAFAGIDIWFVNPQDLSDFNYIEMQIKFHDENGRCRFILRDGFGGIGEVILGDGKIIFASSDEQIVRLEIGKYFPNIAQNSVREIILDAHGYFFYGNNSFTVSGIRFLK